MILRYPILMMIVYHAGLFCGGVGSGFISSLGSIFISCGFVSPALSPSGFFSYPSGFFSYPSGFFSSSGFLCWAASSSGVFFLYSPDSSLKMGLWLRRVLNLILPTTSFLCSRSRAKSCSLVLSTSRSCLSRAREPTTSSSSTTSMVMEVMDWGQMKVRCSSFQTGWAVLLSGDFLVSSTSSPATTLTAHSMSPKVLVLLLRSAVSKRKLRTSTGSSLKVAARVMKPACLRSQLRKQRRGTVWGSFSTFWPGSGYGFLTWRALRQGSRSMMPYPMGLSLPAVLLSSTSISRHRPQNLKQLLTMNLKTSLNLGFFPPFFTTDPVRCWFENFMLTQGSMANTVLVQCSISASISFTSSTPNTVSRFLFSFTPYRLELAQPILFYLYYTTQQNTYQHLSSPMREGSAGQCRAVQGRGGGVIGW